MKTIIIDGKRAFEAMKDTINVSGMNLECVKLFKEIQDLVKEFKKLNLQNQMNQSKALTLGRDAGRNPQKEKGERNGILDKRS